MSNYELVIQTFNMFSYCIRTVLKFVSDNAIICAIFSGLLLVEIEYIRKNLPWNKLRIIYRQHNEFCKITIKNRSWKWVDENSFVMNKPILYFNTDVKIISNPKTSYSVNLEGNRYLHLYYLKQKVAMTLTVKLENPNMPLVVFSQAIQKGFGPLEIKGITTKAKTWIGYVFGSGKLALYAFMVTSLVFWGLRSFKIPLTVWNELIAAVSPLITTFFVTFFAASFVFNFLVKAKDTWQIRELFETAAYSYDYAKAA